MADESLRFSSFASLRSALVIAHPGHELRLYGWFKLAKPVVHVLTDGSGLKGFSRLHPTTRLIVKNGARPGSVYGRFPDKDIYAAMLQNNQSVFTAIAEELADAFVSGEIDCVIGDALEGYETAHDVCRMIIDTAVEIASRKSGLRIRNFDYLLIGHPREQASALRSRHAIWHELDDETLEEKIKEAHDYKELADERDVFLSRINPELFRAECLCPVPVHSALAPAAEKPYYEQYAEKMVAAGRFKEAIRYRRHILPIAEALLETAGLSDARL